MAYYFLIILPPPKPEPLVIWNGHQMLTLLAFLLILCFVVILCAVSNAVLKRSPRLFCPWLIIPGAKEHNCPPHLCRPRRIIPGTMESPPSEPDHHHPQTAPSPPPIDVPRTTHHAPSPPTNHSRDNGAYTQGKSTSRQDHTPPRPLPL